MNKPNGDAPLADSTYEKLYNKPLTVQKQAEMRFNLVRYIELLIVLDKQHKDWLAARPQVADTKNTVSN